MALTFNRALHFISKKHFKIINCSNIYYTVEFSVLWTFGICKRSLLDNLYTYILQLKRNTSLNNNKAVTFNYAIHFTLKRELCYVLLENIW